MSAGIYQSTWIQATSSRPTVTHGISAPAGAKGFIRERRKRLEIREPDAAADHERSEADSLEHLFMLLIWTT